MRAIGIHTCGTPTLVPRTVAHTTADAVRKQGEPGETQGDFEELSGWGGVTFKSFRGQ